MADTEHQLSVALVATATLGLLIALGMSWTYFDSVAGSARERLRSHGDPVLAAADSYSYLHLLIVAGVIIYAGGIRRGRGGWRARSGGPGLAGRGPGR